MKDKRIWFLTTFMAIAGMVLHQVLTDLGLRVWLSFGLVAALVFLGTVFSYHCFEKFDKK